MSSKELDRLHWLQRLADKRATQRQAADALGLTVRQVQRLRDAYEARGAAGLVSARRGKRSNRALPDSFRAYVVELVRDRYLDFGPTLAHEKLAELHGVKATSSLMELRFVRSESTFDYFASTERYLKRYGRPVAFYSDKLSVFRVTAKEAVAGVGYTQFGRAMRDLNIDVICANTPAAKGRVERAHQTLQDRLVKELRLRGISDPEARARSQVQA